MMESSFADWTPTGETGKSYRARLASGFLEKYFSGPVVLDIGFRGQSSVEDARPVVPHAVGVDLDYPGYDGTTLPFRDGTVDTVFSSHLLEHVIDYKAIIKDWYRVLRVGGYIVCHVPHQHLYEKKLEPPSRFNLDHKRFYTPASLIREFEESLEPNSYRLRYMADFDELNDYGAGPEIHGAWGYEIQMVLQKIAKPDWILE
jgi:SAM-dependent methyltransferase